MSAVPRLDTLSRRVQLRLLAKHAAGRARLTSLLQHNESALAALDKLRELRADLPDDSRERKQLHRNIAAVQRVLGRVAA